MQEPLDNFWWVFKEKNHMIVLCPKAVEPFSAFGDAKLVKISL